MDSAELKKIMDRHGFNVVDISAATRLCTATIRKFLNGGRISDSTLLYLSHWVASLEDSDSPRRKTASQVAP